MPKKLEKKLYMVAENWKDAEGVYQRLWDRGRMLPKGLEFISAWIDENIERSFRLMQTHDRRLLDEWIAKWRDLVDFDVCPVITPEEAGEKIAARIRKSSSIRSAGPV